MYTYQPLVVGLISLFFMAVTIRASPYPEVENIYGNLRVKTRDDSGTSDNWGIKLFHTTDCSGPYVENAGTSGGITKSVCTEIDDGAVESAQVYSNVGTWTFTFYESDDGYCSTDYNLKHVTVDTPSTPLEAEGSCVPLTSGKTPRSYSVAEET